MFFSVIIPSVNYNNYLNKNLEYLSKQTFKDFEVIVISENNFEKELTKYDLNLKFIFNKNKLMPGEKRNIAAKNSNGSYLAFIDDDAFPQNDWLYEAHNKLSKIENIKICLGGPGIIPSDENFFGKCADLFFSSPIFHSDNFRCKSIPKLAGKELYDWPSVNLIINKRFYESLGGFHNLYWPGEDSKLCKEVIINNGKILYMPKMIVYHYKRSNIKKHLKQIYRYGLHRGIFFKNKDHNSFRFKYTIPSIFLLSHLLIFVNFQIIYYTLLIYLLFLISEILIIKDIKEKILIFFISRFLIYLSHMTYGLGFLAGLIKNNYKKSLYR